MSTYLNIAQILIACVLIVAILLQAKGAGLGGIFGTGESVYRTRRGVEKTLFQTTIALAVIFVLLSIVSVKIAF
jgi:preprotein translocase subunit SecG